MKVGVLAFQGAVREHINMLKMAGAQPVPVKKEEELNDVDALILPGGESTVIGKFLRETGLGKIIVEKAKNGMPIWGTCAGMILLAKKIVNEDYVHLGLMDIWVRRNAYGSQLDSFIVRKPVPAVSPKPLELVFIRAPYAEKALPGVEVLLELDGKIVAARQNNLLATAFHPEVTDDPSFHKFFLEMIPSSK
ncbi:Pyridoxal 5'-phosphate synthase subunit PdxT [Fervidicola ferrireducens]|jgi:5'-phosphate synthase pdxT subunit|uniref:Pyridoxal 5'-phosphate synthase subunit PdxT n=1 Tax=Fervidicola ferrireducens TaxID=520764 RepID=A0A140L7K2_9FIRM|nr:pyridoxal 5'-phosphate synthase glutaminase subunit PdxT [Fervidicola ferrireducens]KXG76527.1 Pyridoxal 5'-phosphate synthase subunit PdxT [Fervidicola ferrireducens]